MIEIIPSAIDLSRDYLVRYWVAELGVSQGRLEQAIGFVGNDSKKLRRFFDDGHRIAIRDASGVGRQVIRITMQDDGFGVQVPYHPAKNGWIYELPLDYAKTKFTVPLSAGKHYTVSDVAKLSFHMNGFVQFSRGGGKPIVSGFNPNLNLIKGAGLRAPDPVRVSMGPLFGVQIYGIENFDQCTTKPVEMFELGELWYRAGEATENDTAFNVEVFMLPNDLLGAARAVNSKRMLRSKLPFKSQIWFEHDIRVVEMPRLPFFLGVIVSRIPADAGLSSGYKIMGPGCGGPGEAKKCIVAQYPCPEMVSTLNPTSLDYRLPEAGEEADK
jgi:hypothetical protein